LRLPAGRTSNCGGHRGDIDEQGATCRRRDSAVDRRRARTPGGPDFGHVHGLNEYVSVKSLLECRDFLYRLVKIYADQR
jgi:acetylornithine deacetylase/succinyl-diaminopimelate desuccinylase-like protein